MDIRTLTKISIFTALVFVATLIIRLPIAATGGYFNLGDSVIYAAALLFGPLVGGIAGGMGAAIADIIGFPIFAPGTFIIKLVEGSITGYAGRKLRPKCNLIGYWRALAVMLGVGLSAATFYIGTNYMAIFGSALLDNIVWAVMALILGAFIIIPGFMPQTQTSWQAISIVLGGVAMVAGYFLYELLLAALIPSLGILAVAEIPLNIGQMLVGMTIALPALRAVQTTLAPAQKPEICNQNSTECTSAGEK